MENKKEINFQDIPATKTLQELADMLRWPLEKLNSLKPNLKSLANGPIYNVGDVVIELMLNDHLSSDELEIGDDGSISELHLAMVRHVFDHVTEASIVGELTEDVLADPSLETPLSRDDWGMLCDAIMMNGGLKKKAWDSVGRQESLVISISKPRMAALFWDRVWSPDPTIPGDIGFRCNTQIESILLGLVPGIVSGIPKIARKDFDFQCDVEDRYFNDPKNEAYVSGQFLKLLSPQLSGVSAKPIQAYFASDETLRGVYTPGATPMAIAAIENFEWIDDTLLTWEQVREIRRDPESRIALRRMLHWLDESMGGKQLEFIEDEIALRMRDYQKAVSKHGLKQILGAFGAFLDAKLLYTLGGGVFAGQLMDADIGVKSGAGIGILIHCVRVGIDSYNVHLDESARLSQSPIAYLHNVKMKVAASKS